MKTLLGLLLLAAPASAAPLCADCNVIFVSLDAVQASHVGALGGRRGATPRLDALASRGALFTQAVSAAAWTVPASMSWFTGTEPSVHKVTNKFAEYPGGKVEIADLGRLSPGLRTLAETMKAAGYATGGFTGDAGVNGMFGFKKGFDVYFDAVPPFHGYERSIPEALAWLAREKPKKFFLFLHGYNAHGQYAPEDGFDRRYVPAGYDGPFDGSPKQQRDLRELGLAGKPLGLTPKDVAFWRAVYDEKISRADAMLGDFFSFLENTGRLKNTVVVLVADHGTEVFEHERFDHGATLYDELVHVPLVVLAPGVPKRRLTHQVDTLSLMPTILDLVGVVPDEGLKAQLRGRSLVPDLRGETAAGRDVFIETDYRLFTHKRGIRTADGWKYVLTVETGRQELYDLRKDPGERKDLSAARPELAERLRARVMDHYRELGAPIEGGLPLGCLAVYGDQCRD